MKNYKILTINPGSTSTKIALFEGEKKVFDANVSHDAKELERFADQAEQLPYRRDTIHALLKENKVSLEGLSACVGRGGGLLSMEGGTYLVDELVLDHSLNSKNGVVHPAGLGPSLAAEFAKEYGVQAYAVNPPDVDEYQDLARMTGIKGVYRTSHHHSLNLKEMAIRHAATLGKKYADCNFVVCHIGGGISVTAHRHGKMVDGILLGEGMVHSKDLVNQITQSCNWIAPVSAYPGEFEMEAMAAGAARVLSGEEEVKHYTGKPAWSGFSFEK